MVFNFDETPPIIESATPLLRSISRFVFVVPSFYRDTCTCFAYRLDDI